MLKEVEPKLVGLACVYVYDIPPANSFVLVRFGIWQLMAARHAAHGYWTSVTDLPMINGGAPRETYICAM
jgi:hypothetical protein